MSDYMYLMAQRDESMNVQWYPRISSGYYYFGENEHFLYTDKDIRLFESADINSNSDFGTDYFGNPNWFVKLQSAGNLNTPLQMAPIIVNAAVEEPQELFAKWKWSNPDDLELLGNTEDDPANPTYWGYISCLRGLAFYDDEVRFYSKYDKADLCYIGTSPPILGYCDWDGDFIQGPPKLRYTSGNLGFTASDEVYSMASSTDNTYLSIREDGVSGVGGYWDCRIQVFNHKTDTSYNLYDSTNWPEFLTTRAPYYQPIPVRGMTYAGGLYLLFCTPRDNNGLLWDVSIARIVEEDGRIVYQIDFPQEVSDRLYTVDDTLSIDDVNGQPFSFNSQVLFPCGLALVDGLWAIVGGDDRVYFISDNGDIAFVSNLPYEDTYSWLGQQYYKRCVSIAYTGRDLLTAVYREDVINELNSEYRDIKYTNIVGLSKGLRKVHPGPINEIPPHRGHSTILGDYRDDDPSGFTRYEDMPVSTAYQYYLNYGDIWIEEIHIDHLPVARIDNDTYSDYNSAFESDAPYIKGDYYDDLYGDTDFDDIIGLFLSNMDLGTDYTGPVFFFEHPAGAKSIQFIYRIKDAFSLMPSRDDSDNSIDTNIVMGKEYDVVSLTFERGNDLYYEAKEIVLNPLFNVNNTGFIYLTNKNEVPFDVSGFLSPNQIKAGGWDVNDKKIFHGDQVCNITLIVLDVYGNPVSGIYVYPRLEFDDRTNEGVTANQYALFEFTDVSDANGKIIGTFRVKDSIPISGDYGIFNILISLEPFPTGIVEQSYVDSLTVKPVSFPIVIRSNS